VVPITARSSKTRDVFLSDGAKPSTNWKTLTASTESLTAAIPTTAGEPMTC
jgi:hypothetical protein